MLTSTMTEFLKWFGRLRHLGGLDLCCTGPELVCEDFAIFMQIKRLRLALKMSLTLLFNYILLYIRLLK